MTNTPLRTFAEPTVPSYKSPAHAIAALRPEEPVYCFNPAEVARLVQPFISDFPGHTLYAVKCNPHPMVLQALYDNGVRHFDTASLAEVRLITSLFPDATCYFMHPVKGRAAIREAYNLGVRHFVLDHETELQKLRAEIPVEHTTLYVRITPPATSAVYDFSRKFGARRHEAAHLLQQVQASGARVGLSFHVGSQCTTPHTFTTTLAVVSAILEEANVSLDVLDIGGGFPATYLDTTPPPLADFFTTIQQGVADLGLPAGVTLLCEPGRSVVATSVELIVQVQLRVEEMLYINDGVYGSFSEVWTGKMQVQPRLHPGDGRMPSSTMIDYTVFGPTCDSVDLLPIKFSLPDDICEGDYIIVSTMGAYSNAIASDFNGFKPKDWVVVG